MTPARAHVGAGVEARLPNKKYRKKHYSNLSGNYICPVAQLYPNWSPTYWFKLTDLIILSGWKSPHYPFVMLNVKSQKFCVGQNAIGFFCVSKHVNHVEINQRTSKIIKCLLNAGK